MEPSTCPICDLSVVADELQMHVTEHFPEEDCAGDFMLAQQIALVPSTPPRALRDGYAIDTSGDLQASSSSSNPNGTENYSSIIPSQKEVRLETKVSLMDLLRKCLESDSDNSVSILSGHVDHYQSESFDTGWGCGWRNIQMLSSHLIKERQEAREALYGGSGHVPDISSLQRWLELAWENGFDIAGALDFKSKICGEKTWIGTTECAALLRSFGLRARIVDFSPGSLITGKDRKHEGGGKVYGPMDTFLAYGKLHGSEDDGSSRNNKCSSSSCDKIAGHQVLIEWVWGYFSGDNVPISGNHGVVLSKKAPLYFQHDGHSRTIVGIQAKRSKGGTQQFNLLIFDPAVNSKAIETSLRDNDGWQKRIKRGVHTLKKPQYQLCFVDRGIANGIELEGLKWLDSILVDISS